VTRFRTLRVAQLSFWFVHADEFCLRAKRHDDVELVAVWDSDHTRGRQKSEQYEVPFVADLAALLSDDTIDAVSICAEPGRHPELVEAAVAAGKHVLVEKPMAADIKGAKRIARAARGSGVQVMPAYNLRFHPVPLFVRDLVQGGAIGDLVRVRRLHGHYGEAEEAGFSASRLTRTWDDPRYERRDSLYFAGSHVALWFEWMFGLPTSVMAMTTTRVAGLPVEDNSTALLNYGDYTGVMEVSETLIAQQAVAEIYGTDGVVVQYRGNLPSTRVINPSRTPVAVFRRASESWSFPDLPPEFLRHEDEYNSVGQFFRALLRGQPVPTDFESGLRSIAILDAAERSSTSRHESFPAEILAETDAEGTSW
jgi:predicted dehydrogenase